MAVMNILKLSQQIRSRLQVTEVKCEKMLVKLKAFKEKNEKLQLAMDAAGHQGKQHMYEARREAEEQLRALRTKVMDVEIYNGQLVHETTVMKEAAAKSKADLAALQHQVSQLQEHNDQLINRSVLLCVCVFYHFFMCNGVEKLNLLMKYRGADNHSPTCQM
jgi:hypothetical protein